MTLVLDNTATLQGPGLHALLIGVSRYRHLPDGGGAAAEEPLGLAQLNSTARTADIIYQWLLKADREQRLPLPLATVRLLLSPSDVESDLTPVDPATWVNISREAKAWRTSAAASTDEMTFFYYAGHGIERTKGDSVLLAADFGDPDGGAILGRAIDMRHIVAGMAPPIDVARQIATTQLYFVDACRTPASDLRQFEWEEVPKIWSIPNSGVDTRAYPIYYAAVPGATAYALPEKQTLFSMALVDCLDRLGGVGPEGNDPRWRVTSLSLNDSLEEAIATVNETYSHLHPDQTYAPGGQARKVTITYLTQPPEVEVELTLDPDSAAPFYTLEIEDRDFNVVLTREPIGAVPLRERLPAGLYSFHAHPSAPKPGFRAVKRLESVALPRFPWKAKVSL
jgi:hypothetical protein